MGRNSDSEEDSDSSVSRPVKRKADRNGEYKSVKRNKHCRASKAKWTAAEDELLTNSVVSHGEGNWKKIAQALGDRSHLQCLHRWQKVLNPALVKGPWKEEEDLKLVELVEACGPKEWSMIASHIPGRIGKQCRERWFNHLSPDVRKTIWSAEEDHIIVDSHLRLGNKWTAISKLLNGRPANAIKNHWNSTLLKRIQDSNVHVKPERTRVKKLIKKAISNPSPSEEDTTDGTESSPAPSTVNTPPTTVNNNFEENPPPAERPNPFWDWSSATNSVTAPNVPPAVNSMGMNVCNYNDTKKFEFGFLDEPSPHLNDPDFGSDDNHSPHVFDGFQSAIVMPEVQNWSDPAEEFGRGPAAFDFHSLGIESSSFYPFPNLIL